MHIVNIAVSQQSLADSLHTSRNSCKLLDSSPIAEGFYEKWLLVDYRNCFRYFLINLMCLWVGTWVINMQTVYIPGYFFVDSLMTHAFKTPSRCYSVDGRLLWNLVMFTIYALCVLLMTLGTIGRLFCWKLLNIPINTWIKPNNLQHLACERSGVRALLTHPLMASGRSWWSKVRHGMCRLTSSFSKFCWIPDKG